MGKQQVHKRLDTAAVRDILTRYEAKQVDQEAARALLGVKRSRFFKLLADYRSHPNAFTVAYERATPKRISPATDMLIKKELLKEKRLVEDPKLPIADYNYAAIHDTLRDRHGLCVSASTIIRRAKEYGCYREPRAKKIHDRQVITNYVGELIQHDASTHHWSPFVDTPWHAITSLDDYSRLLVFADLFETENRWAHISAVESAVLNYGIPRAYYVDQHSIFRFVKKRDSLWQKNILETDDVDPQWKQVLQELSIQPIYALSPQAKGKIERPYGWMQARVVRRCAQDHVTKFPEVRQIFREEAERYNFRQVHSTTKEIPIYRFEHALKHGRTMFRRFTVPPPYQSSKDIFCLKAVRVVDAYRQVSLHTLKITVPKAPPRTPVELKIIPNPERHLVEVRIWWNQSLISTQVFKEQDLPVIQL